MDPSINLDMILGNIAQYYSNIHTDMLHWSMASTLPVCKSVAHFIDISTTNNLTTLQIITFHFYYPFSFVLYIITILDR